MTIGRDDLGRDGGAELAEALALHAVGATDPRQAEALERLAAIDPAVAAELAELEATAAWLALDTPAVAPSPALRERLLTRTAGSPTVAVDPPKRGWLGALAPAVAMAAGTALVLGFALERRLDALESELAARGRHLETARVELARERARGSFLTSVEVFEIRLAGTELAPGARAKIALDRRNGTAQLFAANLPSPPSGKAYQLWSIPGSTPLPGGVFRPDRSGRAELTDRIPQDALDGGVFAVTLEPAEGVDAPTGGIVLSSAT